MPPQPAAPQVHSGTGGVQFKVHSGGPPGHGNPAAGRHVAPFAASPTATPTAAPTTRVVASPMAQQSPVRVAPTAAPIAFGAKVRSDPPAGYTPKSIYKIVSTTPPPEQFVEAQPVSDVSQVVGSSAQVWMSAAMATTPYVLVREEGVVVDHAWVDQAKQRLAVSTSPLVVAAGGLTFTADNVASARPVAQGEADIGCGAWLVDLGTARMIAQYVDGMPPTMNERGAALAAAWALQLTGGELAVVPGLPPFPLSMPDPACYATSRAGVPPSILEWVPICVIEAYAANAVTQPIEAPAVQGLAPVPVSDEGAAE